MVQIDSKNQKGNGTNGKLRVAAYIRVSTTSADQENSFETQKRSFTELIDSNPNWINAGIYADKGVSGRSNCNRVGYQKMLRHCKEGRIDRIICKSISRFARNTMDFIGAMQILRENNVSIIFEAEGIDTNKMKNEFILTSLAAIAQEESQSISQNIRWGIEKRYKAGSAPNFAIYGYKFTDENCEKLENKESHGAKELTIDEGEADVVRKVFLAIHEGFTYAEVARMLNSENITPPSQTGGWTASQISRMTSQEKYCGDTLIKKSSAGVFDISNNCKNVRYQTKQILRDHHPGIVSRELFNAVQKVKFRDAKRCVKHQKCEHRVLSGRVICAECGKKFTFRRAKNDVIWYCPTAERNYDKNQCFAESIMESDLLRVVRRGFIDRFGLNCRAINDEITEADILNCDEDVEFKYSDDFLDNLIKILENFTAEEKADKYENDIRKFLEYLSGFNNVAGLFLQLKHSEKYIQTLEKDSKLRIDALKILRDIQKVGKGSKTFLKDIEKFPIGAFVISISVKSDNIFIVRWYDDSNTLVRINREKIYSKRRQKRRKGKIIKFETDFYQKKYDKNHELMEVNMIDKKSNSKNVEVNFIPAKECEAMAEKNIKEDNLLRTAAYCRVSTDDECQQNSYQSQVNYYTKIISEDSSRILVGIYADEAISGTSRVGRKGFNEMMEAALNGEIDNIITKSISRFARNTMDTLNCVRQLKEHDPPIGVYFEKENIYTLDGKSELILTILSALAQEESRSISENIRWAIQKKFQRGEPIVNLKYFLGYDEGEYGEWLINDKQAEIVRYIFSSFINGKSANKIAMELNEIGVKTVRNCQWRADSVLRIIRNEKYKGDCECQKTYTKSFLTHESVENNGEMPKYYIRNHHAAIIDKEVWDKANAMLRGANNNDNKMKKRRGMQDSIFSGITIDGKPAKRMHYNSTEKDFCDERSVSAQGLDAKKYTERYYFSYPVWHCQGYDGGRTVTEMALKQSFMECLYRIKYDYDEKGEDCFLSKIFYEYYEKFKATTSLSVGSPINTVSNSILEYESIISGDYRDKKASLLQDIYDAPKRNFDLFIRCISSLPQDICCGSKINIISNLSDLNKESFEFTGIDSAPDILKFETGIYRAFIKSIRIIGGDAYYQTNFGVELSSCGNDRNLSDFLGYRFVDGNALHLVCYKHQAAGSNLFYKRRLRKGQK